MQITLPDQYGYVALAVCSYVFLTEVRPSFDLFATATVDAILSQWQSALVGGLRGKAKVQYPQGKKALQLMMTASSSLCRFAPAYADKAQQDASKEALVFNCAQRAHSNTMERLPTMMFL